MTPALAPLFSPAALVRRALLGLGLLAAPAAALRAADDGIVELPPLEVVSTNASGKPWQYAVFAGGEVLARTSPAATRDFMAAHFRVQQVVSTVLPESLQGRRSVPDLFILTPKGDGSNLSKDIVAAAAASATMPPPEAGEDRSRVRVSEYLRLSDIDATAVYAVLDEFSFQGATFQFLPPQIRFMLETRVPRLPEWFMIGMEQLFARATVTQDTIIFRSATWAPEPMADRIIGSADYAPPLLPMADIFEKPCPPAQGATLAAAQLWRSQAALFVRWMIENESRRAQLPRLLERTDAAGLSDALCAEILGLNYAQVGARLRDYVREALLRESFRIKAPRLNPLPSTEVRPATPAEIARLRGEWERLAIKWVRHHQPRYVDLYVSQARRTFTQAYDRGERDPGVLAGLGLLQVDLGDDAAARPHLEAAVAAQVVRPRAYFELARIRYVSALRETKPGESLITPAQVNTVLAPFRVGAAQSPPLLENYRLISDAWSHSTALLGPEQFALCDRALRLFPRDPILLYNIAALKTFHGRADEAAALLRRGLTASDTPELRARFEKMLARLASP